MAKITGIQIKKDARGHASQVIIDVRKHPELVENLLDALDVVERAKEPLIPAEEVYKKIEIKWKK